MNFRKTFKKIIAVSMVVGILATGSVITGYAKYVKVGNTIKRFAVSKRDTGSFGCGYLPKCTQVDQTDSYVTIFNKASYTKGHAYAMIRGDSTKYDYRTYYIAKNRPSPYTYRYTKTPAGTVGHYWSNEGGGGFRTNMTVYRYK